ncbi:MAG: oxygenase MpaB family protein [Acidimicrobiales bacterium]
MVADQLPLSRQSVFWRVNSEPAIFLGGGRALLMQVAHPGVGAGVEQHSSFASDPWGRLFRTVDIMMKLSFGSPEVSARQQRILDKMHRRVVGTTDDGTPYSAHDTDLQLWVWATLVDTALVVYERLNGRLRPADRATYYDESKLMAYGCGVERGACPDTMAHFEAYVARVVANDLRVTESARRVATAAMVPPIPGPLSPLAATPNRLMTVGLMPPSLRAGYGFEWTDADERALDRFLVATRAVHRVTPTLVRRLPTELAVRQKHALRVPWLQRRGAELTAERLAVAGHAS